MKHVVEIKNNGNFTTHSEHFFFENARIEADKLSKQFPKSLIIIKTQTGTANVYGYGGKLL